MRRPAPACSVRTSDTCSPRFSQLSSFKHVLDGLRLVQSEWREPAHRSQDRISLFWSVVDQSKPGAAALRHILLSNRSRSPLLRRDRAAPLGATVASLGPRPRLLPACKGLPAAARRDDHVPGPCAERRGGTVSGPPGVDLKRAGDNVYSGTGADQGPGCPALAQTRRCTGVEGGGAPPAAWEDHAMPSTY